MDLKKAEIDQLINNWKILKTLGIISRKRKFLIQCQCGNKRIKTISQIQKTKCCNECSRKIQTTLGGPRKTHGCCSIDSPNYKIYMAWHYMHRRCEGKTIKDKRNYVDRGITICERWHRETGSIWRNSGSRT
jgi:hypothetical protein